MSGDQVRGGPIFDFHARLAPRPSARDRLLATMDALGIARAAISSGGVVDLDRLATHVMVGGHVVDDADNEAVAAACWRTDGRLVPFFFGNPHQPAERYLTVADEFAGLELSPAVHGVALTDERNMALVEVAARHQHPVYVVCIGWPGCTAADLVKLAESFPDVPFVLGHCGFVGIDVYSINTVRDTENVLAETSGCYTGIARVAVERLGHDRVLFGTEHPLQASEVELAKLRALELDDEAWQHVMWRNACRLLGDEAP